MSNILRKAVEEKRRQIINQLIVFGVYKNDEQLLELTLTELINEYKGIQSNIHPHSAEGSIRWTYK